MKTGARPVFYDDGGLAHETLDEATLRSALLALSAAAEAKPPYPDLILLKRMASNWLSLRSSLNRLYEDVTRIERELANLEDK